MPRRWSGSVSDLPDAARVTACRAPGPGRRAAGADIGLLESALARPRATAFGADAYSDLEAKAATLLHSLARNHALVDGNKRLALAGVISFYGVNGRRLTLSNDEAYDLVIAVADGTLDAAGQIADQLARATKPWL